MAGWKINVLVLLTLFSYTICKPSPSYDTIVIGLGSAGTTAASTLAKAGKRVLALEAQDRVGGRVKTVDFGDGVVEVGGEWIHGKHPSRVYDSAVDNKVDVLEQGLDTEIFQIGTNKYNVGLINELLNYSYKVYEEPPEVAQPKGQHIIAKLKEYLKRNHPDVLEDEEFVNAFINLMNISVSNYEASNDWNDLSTFTTDEDLEGYKYVSWHRHGYRTFFEILLNKYNNGPGLPTLEIKLNKEVTQIKWPKDSSGNVEVICKDGDKYTANNVIVTMSLGVLKERYSTLFTPPLPQEKVNAIDNISFGVLGKIILSFAEPWWSVRKWPIFFWKARDVAKLDGDEKWLAMVNSASFPMGSNNTMTFWISGNSAKLMETLPEDVVQAKIMKLMRMFIKNDYAISEPTGIVKSGWYSNPFTRGSYTYDNLLTPQNPTIRSTLGEPLVDSSGNYKVLFAGEATDVLHYGTVHGASDSGFREASRLL